MKSTSAILLIFLIAGPFAVYSQVTATITCGKDEGACPGGYSYRITPASGSSQVPKSYCTTGCTNTNSITVTMWQCEQNYAGEYCSTQICFNGTNTYTAAPYPAITCTNSSVTTSCGNCPSTVNCGSCATTNSKAWCLQNSCTYSNATVTNKGCNGTDMFGDVLNNCCNFYKWNDASGNNGICSLGTNLPGQQYIADFLGIAPLIM